MLIHKALGRSGLYDGDVATHFEKVTQFEKFRQNVLNLIPL